jgi:hypothetical protein
VGAQHDADHDHEHGEEEELLGISLLWDANTRSLVALYQIAGASATLGRKINDSEQVVGQVEFPLPDEEDEDEDHEDEDHEDEDHESHGHQSLGFIRQADGSTSTFTVPGASKTLIGGINNHGQIVGGFTVEDGSGRPLRGFLRHDEATFTPFNVLDEDGTSLPTQADAINDSGVIVGYFTQGSHDHDPDHDDDADHEHEADEEPVQPFLRKSTGAIFRFSIPDASQARFSDINNQGFISGFSVGADGARQALVLTPVQPAPNTFFRDTPQDGEDHDHNH